MLTTQSQTASIVQLPLEVLRLILDKVEGGVSKGGRRYTLLPYVVVCQYWRDAILERVYRRILLRNPKQAKLLADQPGALRRYPTNALVMDSQSKLFERNHLWSILDDCPGIAELDLGFNMDPTWTSLFEHPSLESLEILSFHRSAPLDTIPNIPFHLRHLKASLFSNLPSHQTALLSIIASASLTSSISTLTSLDLHIFGSFEPLVGLLSIGPTLKSLKLSGFHLTISDAEPLPLQLSPLRQFLHVATSLVDFHFAPSYVAKPTLISQSLPLIFDAMRSTLKTVLFTIEAASLANTVLAAIVEALATSIALSKLEEIELWYQTWLTMGKYDEWEALITIVDERQITLGARREK